MKECGHDSHEKYELLIGPLRERAKELGYAIGVHGTLKRDIDLIACPWSEEAVPAEVLAEALRVVAEKINGFAASNELEVDEYFMAGSPGAKAHGRLCWTFHLGGGPYIDLSVMPRIREMHLDLMRARANHLEAKAQVGSKKLENDRLKVERRGFQIMARRMLESQNPGFWRAAMEDGKYERAGGDAECQECRQPLVEHPQLPGFPTFHMICRGEIVKL